MAANLKKTVRVNTDTKTGKTKLTRVHAYDASNARKVAKSRTKRTVSPAKARIVSVGAPASTGGAKSNISFQYTDATGRKPKTVKATRAA